MITPALPTIFDVLKIIAPDYKYVCQPQQMPIMDMRLHRHVERILAWAGTSIDTLETVKVTADSDFGTLRSQMVSKEVQQDLIDALNSTECSKGLYVLKWEYSTCYSVYYPSKDNTHLSIEQCMMFLARLNQIQDAFLMSPDWTLEKMKSAAKTNFLEKHQYLREIRDRYRFLMFTNFGEGV